MFDGVVENVNQEFKLPCLPPGRYLLSAKTYIEDEYRPPGRVDKQLLFGRHPEYFGSAEVTIDESKSLTGGVDRNGVAVRDVSIEMTGVGELHVPDAWEDKIVPDSKRDKGDGSGDGDSAKQD